ncbi:MAG TPA: tetratricopeptide repeat protein, partial [Methylothermaceae bacterium]|nr:tetratricopeptide repeat protein [Methylothermaceae bacterium]
MCIFRILLLILFALIVSACQPERTDAEHVSSAKEHIQKGELAASIIELKSELQKNPENAEARRLLGELYVQVGNGQAAEKELRQAMELGVAREALMLTLTKALAMQNEYQKLLDEIEAPSTLSSEQQAKIKSYRGDAWLSLGKPDKAKFEYESALQLYPTEPLAKLGLAKIALIEQDMNTANKLVEEALKYGKEDAALWRFKAYLKRVQGDLKKAEELYTKALELNSEYEE